jgi:hypothetical protein
MVKMPKNTNNTNNTKGGAPTNYFLHYVSSLFGSLNYYVLQLNSSKFFAGVIMILLNVGAKFITIQFSKSTEEYLKNTVSKQILVFAMAWMGTRDIYAALGLTAVFTILSDYLFNEESALCVVPPKYRILHKLIDTDGDGQVSEAELAAAMSTLEKANKEKHQLNQKKAFSNFNFRLNN